MVANFKFAQLQTFYLYGAGAIAGATTLTLKSMKDIDGNPISMINAFGLRGTGTLQPNEGEFEESISFTGLVNNANGTTTLTGVKSVTFLDPYTETSGIAKTHPGSSSFIISNTSAFEDTMANKNNTGNVVATWTFNAVGDNANPKIDDPSYTPVSTDYVVKQYVDSAVAAATKVNVVNVNSSSSLNVQVGSLTYSNTYSGTNRGALIQLSTQQSVTVSSVTVGGVSASQIESVSDVGSNLRSEIWFLAAPPLGAQNTVITLSGNAYIASGSVALINVDQATPTGATQTATGANTHPTLSINTTVDSSTVFDSLATTEAGITYTAGAGQTLEWSELAGTYQGGSSGEPAGSAPDAITMDYTVSISTDWAYCAVEVNPTVVIAVSDHKVLVSALDTTANYLQPKLVAGTGITITPSGAGNETLTFAATGGGSSSAGDQNIGGVYNAGNTVNSTTCSSLNSDATGVTIFTTGFGRFSSTGNGYIQRYVKDTNTGMYRNTHAVTGQNSSSQSSYGVLLGTKFYVFVRDSNTLKGTSYTAADLTGNAALSFSDSPAITVQPVAFTDGTFIYIQINASGTFRKYSVSGSVLTFVSNITGGVANAAAAYMQGSSIYMSSATSDVQVFTISGTAFVAGTSVNYNIPYLGGTDTQNTILGFGFISATVFYFCYQLASETQSGTTSGIQRPNFYLKPFTLPV